MKHLRLQAREVTFEVCVSFHLQSFYVAKKYICNLSLLLAFKVDQKMKAVGLVNIDHIRL